MVEYMQSFQVFHYIFFLPKYSKYIIMRHKVNNKDVPSHMWPRKDSDQHARLHGLIRIVFGAFWIANDAKFLHAESEDSDGTV